MLGICGVKTFVYKIPLDYDAIQKSDILNIHKYLTVKKKPSQKSDCELSCFSRSLASIVNTPGHT